MTEKRFVPTPAQQRLVNIGMVLQFHCAAIGHLVVWLWMLYELMNPHSEYDLLEVFVYAGIPISFGILVAVYILFRCLLAYANFSTALKAMLAINILHSLLMGFTIIVPARLAIPIVLYSFAYYYYVTVPQETTPKDIQKYNLITSFHHEK